MNQSCPCCCSANTTFLKESDGYDYFQCQDCASLFISPDYIAKIDQGYNIVKYDKNYWNMELEAARQRSYSGSLARMAETIYYCKRPVKKFLDIGTGPGYFLDAVAKLLPDNASVFYGIELFPPEDQFRTMSKNYITGDMTAVTDKFDCGMCIEVIEHLTPTMLDDMLGKLANISNPDALYIFNTGMPDYVLNEDIKYLDPTHRGHIVSYSLRAMQLLAGKHGFTVHRIIGKPWAFALEFSTPADSNTPEPEDIRSRVWKAPEYNLNILCDREMGSVLKVLGLETVIAYN